MVYTNTQGVILKDKNKLAMFLVAIGFAIFATIGMILPTRAATLDPFPSTNDLNRDADAPHVNLVSQTTEEVTLDFVNPTGKDVWFEVRLDDEPQTGTSQWGICTTEADPLNPSCNGLRYLEHGEASWPSKMIAPNTTTTDSFSVSDNVSVRMSFGPERNWDFDWVQFDVLTPPEAPTNVQLFESGGDEISNGGSTDSYNVLATWDAVDDADHYQYRYWNSIPGDTYNAPNYYETNPTGTSQPGEFNRGEGLHHFQVRAVSEEGVFSEWSAQFDVTYDVTAPVVNIDEPTDGEEVSGSIDIVGDVTDNLGLSHYNLSLYSGDVDLSDGETHIGDRITDDWCSGTVNVSGTGFENKVLCDDWDTTQYADGEYQIRLAARDEAGNRDITNVETGGDSSVHVITIVIDNHPDEKDECKNGGWEMGLEDGTEFRNQGDCVSYFASDNQQENNPDGNRNENGARRR